MTSRSINKVGAFQCLREKDYFAIWYTVPSCINIKAACIPVHNLLLLIEVFVVLIEDSRMSEIQLLHVI